MGEKQDFKPDREIIKRLQSGDEKTNLSVVETMKSSGEAGYLPYLIELAHTTRFEKVKSQVFSLLNQLKHKEAITYLADAIRNEQYQSIRKELVEACWQNGLDYAGHFSLFTDLLIHGSEEISFEAFTVIENMGHMPENNVLQKEAAKIKSHLQGTEEGKRYVLAETLKIIDGILNQKDDLTEI